MLRRPKPCEFGAGVPLCGAPATTKRKRVGGKTENLCGHHADLLDRVRRRVAEDAALLERLATM